MGKANKQRRQAKEKARRQSAARSAHTGAAFGLKDPFAAFAADPFAAWQPPKPTIDEQVGDLLYAGMHALDHKDLDGCQNAGAELAALMASPAGHRAVGAGLNRLLFTMIREAWGHGWQPADVARVAGRQLTARPARMVGDVMVAELAQYAPATVDPRWLDQLDELDLKQWWPGETTFVFARCEQYGAGGALASFIEAAHVMSRFPVLERHGALPGHYRAAPRRPGPDVDDRVLSRVRALLAKAESTTFPAEAETFTAGAQALMARHSIDAALLAATETKNAPVVTGRRIGIDNPYEAPKASLLQSVATANRCRTVWRRDFGFSSVIGFDTDLDIVETLFTSLLVQATAALNREGAHSGAGARTRSKSFRQSFLLAYAGRIGERLSAAIATETETMVAEQGTAGSALVPVLTARSEAVDEAVAQMFPDLTRGPASAITDMAGYHSGLSAADRAALGVGEAVTG